MSERSARSSGNTLTQTATPCKPRTRKATLKSPTSRTLASVGAFLDSALDDLAQAAVELAALAKDTDGRTAATLALDLRRITGDAHAVAEVVSFWHTREMLFLRERAEAEASTEGEAA